MKRIGVLLIFLTLFALTSMQAQQHRERWVATDYFPKYHFVSTYDSTRTEERAGEVAFYMRLAGLKSWKDTSREEANTMIRVSMLPKYSHPMFIEVSIVEDGGCYLSFRRGNAICGYVEHTTRFKMSDTGYYDATEEHYKGNQWTEGMIEDGNNIIEKWLTTKQLDSLNRLLGEVDLPHHPHITRCSGFQPAYVIEYRYGKTYNAVYDECYEGSLGILVKYLVSLADTTCADMVIHTPNKSSGITPAQFPGGDSAYNAFIADNMHYPEQALIELEEGKGSVKIVVERDGSLYFVENDETVGKDKDKYGFCAEAKRLFDLMPRWQPAMDNGRPVRSEARITVRFTLPDSLQPVYGTPILETFRDTNSWNNILAFNRRLLNKPQNQEYCFRMGIQYYREFLLPMKARILTTYDTLRHEWGGESWESILDNTPVVKGAADSALRYFYRALTATDSFNLDNIIKMYLPIRQLEQYLGLPYNPLNELPYDTVPGIHYPYSYFIDLPANGHLDSTVDYIIYDYPRRSYFWVDVFSQYLDSMSEPVLFDRLLTLGDTIFRFAFYPSFHPPLCFRVERTGGKTMLYWTKLDYIVDERTTTSNTIQGNRKLRKREYRKLMNLFAALDFDNKPRLECWSITDGAQWVIERRTADNFKAYYTNLGFMKIDALYSYLISLACIEADYASGYCHW